MKRELGSVADQRALSPLLIEGKTYREAMVLLGWPYGRVSEAARAIKGMDSDSRDGRSLRGRHVEARARTMAALKVEIAAYRARIAF